MRTQFLKALNLRVTKMSRLELPKRRFRKLPRDDVSSLRISLKMTTYQQFKLKRSRNTLSSRVTSNQVSIVSKARRLLMFHQMSSIIKSRTSSIGRDAKLTRFALRLVASQPKCSMIRTSATQVAQKKLSSTIVTFLKQTKLTRKTEKLPKCRGKGSLQPLRKTRLLQLSTSSSRSRQSLIDRTMKSHSNKRQQSDLPLNH